MGSYTHARMCTLGGGVLCQAEAAAGATGGMRIDVPSNGRVRPRAGSSRVETSRAGGGYGRVAALDCPFGASEGVQSAATRGWVGLSVWGAHAFWRSTPFP